MKIILSLMCVLPLFFAPCSLQFTDFDCFQNRFTKQDIENRLQTFLKKDAEVEEYYRLTTQSFILYATPEDKKADRPEYTLSFASNPILFEKIISYPNELKGLKIALDPGHFGGKYKKLEERWVSFAAGGPYDFPTSIEFDEGTLALLTAKRLKTLLEAEGAVVLLTKDKVGQGVYEQDFETWLQNSKQTIPSSQLFRFVYNRLDLQARAEKINGFKPDLTIIIHYNVHVDPSHETEDHPISLYNYNMAFIGGGFQKGELSTSESRYHFLRLLLTEDVKRSAELSQEILQEFTIQLDISPIDDKIAPNYLTKNSLKITEGVYSRNLCLTRLVKGPICYGESLCQNHYEECLRLNDKTFRLEGISGPLRVKAVAQAYFDGIKAFIKHSKPK